LHQNFQTYRIIFRFNATPKNGSKWQLRWWSPTPRRPLQFHRLVWTNVPTSSFRSVSFHPIRRPPTPPQVQWHRVSDGHFTNLRVESQPAPLTLIRFVHWPLRTTTLRSKSTLSQLTFN
jgi:hypothetical protein